MANLVKSALMAAIGQSAKNMKANGNFHVPTPEDRNAAFFLASRGSLEIPGLEQSPPAEMNAFGQPVDPVELSNISPEEIALGPPVQTEANKNPVLNYLLNMVSGGVTTAFGEWMESTTVRGMVGINIPLIGTVAGPILEETSGLVFKDGIDKNLQDHEIELNQSEYIDTTPPEESETGSIKEYLDLGKMKAIAYGFVASGMMTMQALLEDIKLKSKELLEAALEEEYPELDVELPEFVLEDQEIDEAPTIEGIEEEFGDVLT